MNVPSAPEHLCWLAAHAPFSEFDPVVKKLWKLLTDEDATTVLSGTPFEQRALPGHDGVSRYTYVNTAEQVFLFQERDARDQPLRDVFCVPTGQYLQIGARVPQATAAVVESFPHLNGVSKVPESSAWPDIAQLRSITEDALVEEQLDDTPVAALIAERDYLAEQLAQTSEALRHSRYTVQSLKAQLGTAAPALDLPLQELAYPETLDEVGTWAEQYSSRMVLAERAVRGGKKSLYRDSETVYRCLEHLATRYWEMKTGKISVAAHDTALMSMPGVSLRGSTVPSVAGECGEAYFISYNGRRVFLDLHLAKGGGTDQRYCMRIYFAWLPDEQKVLVGDLPAHLANSLT